MINMEQVKIYFGAEILVYDDGNISYDGADERILESIDFARKNGKIGFYLKEMLQPCFIDVKEPAVIVGIAIISSCKFKLECCNLIFNFPYDATQAICILSTLITPFESENDRQESLIYYLNRENILYETNN